MIGAYRATENFAYPGWRLTVPGGPAGGHYKGFTHTQAAGTDIPPNDPYEQDREDGMSSHDPVHASRRNPRGVYRSSAEVPPRPNASGRAMTYAGYQTERHPGTSISPGSFPAEFIETDEDDFLSGLEHLGGIGALTLTQAYALADSIAARGTPATPAELAQINEAQATQPVRPGYVLLPSYNGQVNTPLYVGSGPGTVEPYVPATTGATSVVRQPAGSLIPAPPLHTVRVYTEPPISPKPAPIVPTNEVVPARDGSGNFINLSTGETVPPESIEQNPATMQLTASSALNWLEQNSLWSKLPNWGVLAIGAGAMLLLGGGAGGRRGR